MKVGLFQTQRQQLALTNQLRQAIELLQYSTMDLAQFIVEQATDNPIINIEEPPVSAINQSYISNKSTGVFPIDSVSNSDESLRDYLQRQLLEAKISKEEKEIVDYLILNVNNKGYILEDLHDLAQLKNWHIDKISAGLTILQQFDPAGVGAINIQQCLLLQLRRLAADTALPEQMVEFFLEDIAKKKWTHIATECNVSEDEVKRAFKLIQSLNPNPASGFGEKPEYIVPDFQVVVNDKSCSVLLNDHLLPKISINGEYEPLLNNHPEAADYLKIQLQHFRWLSRSISQRKNTLQKVMEELSSHQERFFIEGPTYLAPLTMREIAEKIEVHESTVSRAVKNKYVQTSHGVYPLKSFFTSKIKSTSGKETSSFVIKQQLVDMIAGEEKTNPLSDQGIVDLFISKGINVSRRTVAKYRSQLGIPSSTMRKER